MTTTLKEMAELNPYLAVARTIFISGCAAEIQGLDTLAGLRERDAPASISGVFLPGINVTDYSALSDQLRLQTYFMTPQLKQGFDLGRVDYCPWRYRDIGSFYSRQPVDLAIVMLSPPDSGGRCSYGIAADFSPIAMSQAVTKIGVVNSQMPHTMGGLGISISELDAVIELEQPLKLGPVPLNDDISTAIARGVNAFIGDGATLQFGVGKAPAAVAQELTDRRELKIASGLLDEPIMALEAAGAISLEQPIVGGVALGSEVFYRALHNNSRYSIQPVTITHDFNRMAATPKLIALNGALEVDVLGQVNSTVTSRGYFSGPGGLPDFVAGALCSPGGRSIIMLPATAAGGTISKIVTRLTGSVASVAATDADIVVTEYGVAELRDKSLRERIRAMIAIAAPEHREELEKQARSLF